MPTLYYTTKEEVPTDLADSVSEVKEDGEHKGKWSVNVVPRKKLEEFRDTNVTIAKEKDDAVTFSKKVLAAVGVAKPEDFDFVKFSEEFNALKDTKRKVDDGKLKASDDVDKVVTERTEVMRQKFDEQLQANAVALNAVKVERDTAVAAFKRTFIDRAVAGAITDPELGVESTAMADIMQRAYSVFIVEEDGSITPKKSGQTMWGEDGSTPMSMKEWIDLALRKEAPHYFKKSNGGGAQGGGDAKQFGGMSEAEFQKLPARRRLEIANQQAFQKGR